MALEFKTPANTGRVTPEQRRFLDELAKAGFRVLISNSYDEICNEIRDYFRSTRALCQECGKWVRATAWEGHALTHAAKEQSTQPEAPVTAAAPEYDSDQCPF